MKNNKLKIMVLCFLLVFSVTVFAVMDCPTKEEYNLRIKEATRDYFAFPSQEKLLRLQEMLKIYATHDFTTCLEGGTEYNFTQVCSDGTAYDSCSATKPLYCDNGSLVSWCTVCDCPENQACKADETCLNKAEAKQTMPWVVQADKTFAEKALETAKNTPVKYPEKYSASVQQEIETAKQLLSQANIEAGNNEHDKAINDYKKSWQHSQEAIRLANILCPSNCVGKCGGASDGCGGSCNAACPDGQVCTNGICTAKPKEEKPLIIKIVEAIVKVIVTIVKAIVKFFKKLFRW